MYFAEFESFAVARENAKSFVVSVMLNDGSIEDSSPVPVAGYEQVMMDIATCDELKSMFAIWTRGERDGWLQFIPYDRIKNIRVRFVM